MGLANRYGSNSCFLNVVVQSLHRLRPFNALFVATYEGPRMARLLALRERLPGSPHGDSVERASVGLLHALLVLLKGLAAAGAHAAVSGGGASKPPAVTATSAGALNCMGFVPAPCTPLTPMRPSTLRPSLEASNSYTVAFAMSVTKSEPGRDGLQNMPWGDCTPAGPHERFSKP